MPDQTAFKTPRAEQDHTCEYFKHKNDPQANHLFPVFCDVAFLQIFDINTIEQRFEADVEIAMTWLDPEFHKEIRKVKWEEAGTEKPSTGTELAKNEKLAEALKSKKEFSPAEWVAFGIEDLQISHFVKSGNKYFKPAGKPWDAKNRDVRQELLQKKSWRPHFVIENLYDLKTVDSWFRCSADWDKADDWISWRSRLRAIFTQQLSLEDFPFDVQLLSIRLASVSKRIHYMPLPDSSHERPPGEPLNAYRRPVHVEVQVQTRTALAVQMKVLVEAPASCEHGSYCPPSASSPVPCPAVTRQNHSVCSARTSCTNLQWTSTNKHGIEPAVDFPVPASMKDLLKLKTNLLEGTLEGIEIELPSKSAQGRSWTKPGTLKQVRPRVMVPPNNITARLQTWKRLDYQASWAYRS